jgi:hypothetical protein
MKTVPYFILIFFAAAFCIAQSKTDEVPLLTDLKTAGAFGFPQKDARVLHDDKNLRFSVTNNSEYLFAQAILWNDGDSSAGKLDGKAIGDYSSIMFLSGSDKKRTPDLDRSYSINPLVNLQGLYYSIVRDSAKLGFGSDKFVSSPLQNDSQGRGRIDYVSTVQGKTARVDSYLIPLGEISKRHGDTIQVCYFGYSPKPSLTVNSVGFNSRELYYDYQIPVNLYRKFTLDLNANIGVTDWLKPK